MAGTAGRSGRRPKPTARKELAGNPGKRALNKEEPVFTPINGVSPPDWFNEEDMPLASVMGTDHQRIVWSGTAVCYGFGCTGALVCRLRVLAESSKKYRKRR